MMQSRTTFNALAILAICLLGIFSPDLTTSDSRLLAAVDESSSRVLQEDAHAPPEGIGFSCPVEGQEAFKVDWASAKLTGDATEQKVTFPNGYSLKMTISSTDPGKAVSWGLDASDNLKFTAGTVLTKADLVSPTGGSDPEYPSGYGTMTLEFDRELEGLYISISDVDSNAATTDAVRIRMYNAASAEVATTIAKTGSIQVKENYAFASLANQRATNPGYEASLYAQATGPVQTIALDQSVFTFQSSKVGQFKQRTIFPALDFQYCAPTVPPTRAPVAPTPAETKPPVGPAPVTPAPVTPAPVAATRPPVDKATPAPVDPIITLAPVAKTKPPADAVTPAPAPPPIDGGVNGDPLIMGLSGQLFKFDGRNGAWYSAVSAPSFQWNMKINKYETCPKYSDTFVSGAGFTFFNKHGKIAKRIEVNVVNNYNVDIGCGDAEPDQNCLGFGSLELVIDGMKHSVGGDYMTEDGTARIVAFNTFYQCSRKWYDFDVRPTLTTTTDGDATTSLRSGRSLANSEPSIFDVISGLQSTMINQEECQQWIQDRQAYGDLFNQPGHYSTIIIKTPEVTFHLEYKQENERCNAHSIDVWISSVSPTLLDEPWEGVIGETKDPNYVSTGEQLMVDRSIALKHARDEDYEVNSPFSKRCKGCNHK